MFNEEDEEYKKRKERAKQLRSFASSNSEIDTDYTAKKERAKQLRNYAGMTTANDKLADEERIKQKMDELWNDKISNDNADSGQEAINNNNEVQNNINSIRNTMTAKQLKEAAEGNNVEPKIATIKKVDSDYEGSNWVEDKVANNTTKIATISNNTNSSNTQNLYSSIENNETTVQVPSTSENVNTIKNKSVLQDIPGIAENLLLGASSGLKQIMNYQTGVNSQYKGYQNITTKLSIAKYLQEKYLMKSDDDFNEAKEYNPIKEFISNSIQKDTKKIVENTSKMSNKATKKISELTPSIGQMGVGTLISSANPALGLEYFMMSAGGSYLDDAKARGMNDREAVLYASIMGAAEGATEQIGLSNIKKAGQTIKGLFSGTAKQGLKQLGKEEIKSGVKAVLKDYGISIADNFIQEALIVPIQEFTAQVVSGEDKADWSNIIERMIQDGIDGALVSVIVGGAELGVDSCISIVDKSQNNRKITQEEIKQAIYDANATNNINVLEKIKNNINGVIKHQTEAIKHADIKLFYTTTYNQDGSLASIQATQGKEIQNLNKKVNITPVVVRNTETNSYNVIDKDTGLLLDSTPYATLIAAEQGFYHKIINLDEASINNINDKISKSNIAINNELMNIVNEARAQLNSNEISTKNSQKSNLNSETSNLLNKNKKTLNIKNSELQIKKDSENFSKQVNDVINGNFPQKDMLTVLTHTPQPLQNIGLPDLPITITQKHLDTIMNKSGKYKNVNYHDLGEEVIKQLPKAISNPLDIIKSNTKDDSIVLTTYLADKQGRPVIASIKIDGKGYVNDVIIDSNVMTSSYGRNNYDKFMQDNIKNGNLLYDIDRGVIKKVANARLQLPRLSNSTTIGSSIDTSISQNTPNVKSETSINNNDMQNNENNTLKVQNNNEGGKENVGRKQNTNVRQEVDTIDQGENAKGKTENAGNNGMVKNTQFQGLRNYQKEQQKIRGKDFKATIISNENISKNENIVLKGFKEATGIDINVYNTNKSTSESAFFNANEIYLKHNSLSDKKATNFKPYHELGHWLKQNKAQQWKNLYNIMNSTITEKQISEYKSVLNDISKYDNMTKEQVKDNIINEIISDYMGNWANDVSNWLELFKNGSINEEYQQFLADISLENKEYGYNVFGTLEQQDRMYNEITNIMTKIINNGNVNFINMEDRTYDNVANKNVLPYAEEHKEISQDIKDMAANFMEDLEYSLPGKRYKAGDTWTGQKRSTTKELAEFKDATGVSWDKIGNILNDIYEGNGNYALAKKMEIELDKALTEGYKNIYGQTIMPNESYLDKKGKIEGKDYNSVNNVDENSSYELSPEELPFSDRSDVDNQDYFDSKKGIWYNKNGIDLTIKEYLARAIDEDSPRLNKGLHVKFYRDCFFVVNKLGHNEYIPIMQIKIEGNENLINNIRKELKNGTIRKAKAIIRTIEEFDNRGRFDNINNANVTGRNRIESNTEIRNKREGKPNNRQNNTTSNKNSNKQLENSKQSSFSMEKDNLGRKLTKEQQEFFKDSKVRDENGNLLVVYHGTDTKFTIFNYDYLGKNGTANGKGFYLADDINVAKSYSDGKNIIEAYVDIQKPLSIGKTTITENDYIKFLEAVNDKTDGGLFTDYGDGEKIQKNSKEYNEIINQFKEEYKYGGDDIDLVLSVLNSANIRLEDGYRLLKNTIGYDGIIVETNYKNNGKNVSYTQYIPLTPEQIKNIDNTTPTDNPDIRLADRNDFDNKSNNSNQDYTEEEQDILSKRQEERIRVAKMIKERSFLHNAITSTTDKEYKKTLRKNRDNFQYRPISNAETMERASTAISKYKDFNSAKNEFLQNNLTSSTDTAVGELLIKQAIAQGDYDEACNLTASLAEKLTTAGQTIQAAAMFRRMTPDGMLLFAQRKINQINKELEKEYKIDNLLKGKNIPQIEMTEEKARFINDMMQQMEAYENQKDNITDGKALETIEREQDIILAKIMAKIGEDIPTSMLDKLASWRNISLLLNPKTIRRNLISNTMFSVLEDVVDTLGVPIDKAISLITGERSLLLPNLKTQAKGLKKGLDYAIYDTREGISTSLGGNKYEIKPTKTFNNKVLGKLETLSYFGVEGLDRSFMQAKYDSALEMIMKLEGLKYGKDIPTEEMKQQALDIAKYTTFKDKNAISDFLSKVKNTLNLGKPIGAADIIGLTYTNIPGNLTKKAIDYSPAGLYNVFKNYKDFKSKKLNGESTRQAQRNLVQSISRILIGTGIMAVSAQAFLKGVITASGDDEDDKLKELTNQENYAINISAFLRWITGGDTTKQNGDLYVTYSNYEPLSSIIAAAAEMAGAAKEGDNVATITYKGLTTWINTIVELSTLNNFSSVFEYGDLGGALTRSIAEFPSSFIPTLLKQIAQFIEPNSKSSYSDNLFVKNFLNPILQRIPGLSSTLESNYDTMGNEKESFNGSTGFARFYNVFLNTSFTSTIDMDSVEQELYDLYLSTGLTDHLPIEVKNTFTYKGEKITLTAEEKAKYQAILGKRTAEAFKEKMATSEYQSMTDEQKVKALSNIITELKTEVRGEVILEPRGLAYDSTFTPTTSSLSKSGYTLNLTDDMQKEYEKIASDYYNKYAKQGLYSTEKLKEIKSKAKEYARNYLMQKYKNQLVKSR